MKPLIGALSDILCVAGYHKRYGILQSTVVGTVGCVFLTTGVHLPAVMVLFFWCIQYEIAVGDLLTEGKYAEIMRKHPETGSDIVTYCNGCQRLGYIISMSFVGPLSDAGHFMAMFFICMGLCVTPLVPTVLGWLPEKRRHMDERGIRYVQWNRGARRCGFVLLDYARYREQRGILLFVAIVGVCGPGLTALTTFGPKLLGFACCVLLLSAAIVGGFFAFPRLVAIVALYQVLTAVSKVDVGTALDYFYTADPETCFPDGPGFSYRYYITFTGIVASVVSFAATVLYQLLFSRWRFRSVLIFTSCLASVGGLFDLAMVLRWNRALRIGDHAFYLLGEAILENVVKMLYWIPSSTIIGKVCVPGLEAATYAFLAGVSNFGQIVASLAGSLAIGWSGLRTVEPDCRWDRLWLLVLVGHIALPLAVGIAAAFLIPNVQQTAQLDDHGNVLEPPESTHSDVELLE